MDRRPSSRQVIEWAEDTLRIRRTCPRSLALYGEEATAVWVGVLDELRGREGLRTFVMLDEDRLRELLFSRLPAQGIPAGQVLGVVEELGELANEARRLALATDEELSRARRVLEPVGADARRASAVATTMARATGAAPLCLGSREACTLTNPREGTARSPGEMIFPYATTTPMSAPVSRNRASIPERLRDRGWHTGIGIRSHMHPTGGLCVCRPLPPCLSGWHTAATTLCRLSMTASSPRLR